MDPRIIIVVFDLFIIYISDSRVGRTILAALAMILAYLIGSGM